MTDQIDNRTLEEQLSQCDGATCQCGAYGRHECACDADWTPAEVYRLRAERDALRDECGTFGGIVDAYEADAVAYRERIKALEAKIDGAPVVDIWQDDDGVTYVATQGGEEGDPTVPYTPFAWPGQWNASMRVALVLLEDSDD